MSFQELLAELPSLTMEQRDLLRTRLIELEGAEWTDDGLTPEEMALIDARIAAHERDPRAVIPWEVMEAKLKARFGL